jgi:hypothetical protein
MRSVTLRCYRRRRTARLDHFDDDGMLRFIYLDDQALLAQGLLICDALCSW